MTCEEKDKMKTLNQKYKDKFGFPFVICARLNKKEAILKGLELRCYNTLKVSMTSVVERSEIQLTEYSRLRNKHRPYAYQILEKKTKKRSQCLD